MIAESDTLATRMESGSAMATLPIATAIHPNGPKVVANSQSEIKKRLAMGEIAWTGPLLLVMTRPGSVRVTAGGTRRRICFAAPPFTLEKRRSLVVGLRDPSKSSR